MLRRTAVAITSKLVVLIAVDAVTVGREPMRSISCARCHLPKSLSYMYAIWSKVRLTAHSQVRY